MLRRGWKGRWKGEDTYDRVRSCFGASHVEYLLLGGERVANVLIVLVLGGLTRRIDELERDVLISSPRKAS